MEVLPGQVIDGRPDRSTGVQLNGKVEITYDSKGFIYALDVPLSALKPSD
jgi:hypothetical protein